MGIVESLVCDRITNMEWSRALHPVRRGWEMALDVVFPPRCTFCSIELISPHTSVFLCQSCRLKLTQTAKSTCLRCGAPPTARLSEDDKCGHCRDLTFQFSQVIPYGWYRGELKQAVKRMKYVNDDPLVASIAQLAADHWTVPLIEYSPDLIVPVPAYWYRRFQRGTYSPDLFALQIARNLRTTALCRLLYCCRKIKKQSMLPPVERISNVEGAFRITKGYDVRGARIVLVDDVLTTGATANAATKSLLVAGAANVAVAVVARALSNQ